MKVNLDSLGRGIGDLLSYAWALMCNAVGIAILLFAGFHFSTITFGMACAYIAMSMLYVLSGDASLVATLMKKYGSLEAVPNSWATWFWIVGVVIALIPGTIQVTFFVSPFMLCLAGINLIFSGIAIASYD